MKNYTGTIGNFLVFLIATPMILFGLAVNIYSGLIFYHQIHFWFKFDKFIDASIYACLTPNEWAGKGPLFYIPKNWSETWLSAWLLHPNDWIGLQKIVVYIFEGFPIYILGFIIATIFMTLGAKIIEAVERCHKN